MPYDPSYIAKELRVSLPSELESLAETLSEKVHDRWAMERMKAGWTWGKTRCDEKLTSPNLIPYHELPEQEKDIDRASVETVLKLLISSGYTIDSKQS